MKIRAITLFVTEFDKNRIEAYTQKLNGINDDMIWTKRIALPPTPSDISTDKILDLLPSDPKNILYSLFHLRSNDKRITEIPSLLQSNPNIYASILLSRPEDAAEVAKLINNLDPEISTRLAILIYNDFLLTPYFPVGSANTFTDSIALSLLYASDYLKGIISRSIVEGNEIGIKYSKMLQLKYLGIDISLSPWMNESVAEIIETKSGKMFSHGNTYAVAEINKELFDTAWKLRITPIGFSEVMLPVAEDLVLMKRVEEGSLKLPHLQQLTFVCVAGLDMIAIPRDVNLYNKLLLDSIAIQFIKRRPYGIRIIPSDGSGYIFINSYGKIPEIKII